MSYDVELVDPVTKKIILLENKHTIRGGTYAIGGTEELWLNITYNYGPIFYKYMDADKGIRWLYGKTGAETISKLEEVISKLNDDADDDYWKPTEGNVKRALCGLLAFARLRPDGIWMGD